MRGLEDDELVTKLKESKEELFNLRFQSATGQLDNNKRLQTVRHDIARIYTVMRERELGLTTAPTVALSEDTMTEATDTTDATDARLAGSARPARATSSATRWPRP